MGETLEYETLSVATDDPVVRVTLARPDVRNAFDERMIAELDALFTRLDDRATTRVVVLAGEGKSFSAGADLGWMRRAAAYTDVENEADARRLAAMLTRIDRCRKPVVVRAHGHVLGGGCGLVAAADTAIAARGTQFGFSEVKLGLVPAVISPFVLARIGVSAARHHFVAGDRFDADEAARIGLVHRVVEADELDAAVDAHVEELLRNGPDAMTEAKRLVEAVALQPMETAHSLTATTLARVRASDEGREGVQAFLERRRPDWSGE